MRAVLGRHRRTVATLGFDLGITTEDRLAERNPPARLRLIRHDVVTLRANTHRQHVVREPRRLVPRRRQRHMALDHGLVLERLHPREPIGVRPDRVVDPAEIGVELAATFLEEVRKQDRHLVVAEGELLGPFQVVPAVQLGRTDRSLGRELVPAVAARTANGRDRAGHHGDEEQAACDLPAAHVAGASGTPVVRRELGRVVTDDRRNLADLVRGDAGDLFGRLGRVLGVVLLHRNLERVPFLGHVRELASQEGFPVHPALDEVLVPRAVFEHAVDDRQQQERLGAGPGRQPVISLGAGVRQTRVADDDRGALVLGFEDALRVRVEVVPRFQVGADEEDDLGVGVVRRRTVVAHPGLVANASVRRADVGVAVVAVNAPGLEHAIGVVGLAGATDVIHDLVVATLVDRRADAVTNLVERLVPRDALPLTAAPLADALHRVHDPLGVIHLVERGGTLGAVAATAGRMLGVALDLVDLARVLVHVTNQATAGFAVEAARGHQRVLLLDLVRPCLGVELGPVVPLLQRRVLRKISHEFLAIAASSLRSFGCSADWCRMAGVMTAGRSGRRGRSCLRRRTCRAGRGRQRLR